MPKPGIILFLLVLAFIPSRLVSQHTPFDIIYCANGGENKSAGIQKLPDPNPQEKPGWKLVFSDEFQSDSLNRAFWNRSTPWDDGDGSCVRNFAMNPANSTSENGFARIPNMLAASLPGCPYSGSELKTMSVRDSAFGSFYFYAPGYLETRVKLFTKPGQGAAAWLWAVGTPENPGTSGPWQEIDLFELNGGNPNIITGTYHWTWNDVHVSQNVNVYLTDSAQQYDLGANWTTFGLEWDTASIKWFVNNSLVKELKMNVIPPFCIPAAHYVLPLAPMCVRLSTSYNTVGNQSAQANPADFPQSMLVDYVRVYKRSGVNTAPIIVPDGISQVCATAVSPETSDKYIRTNYYPGVTCEWSSPAFNLDPVPFSVPQPPGKMHLWIKPGITAGASYPVFLKSVFPGNITEYDTAWFFIPQEAPGMPPDNFSPIQLDTLCYFAISTPALPGAARCEYTLDNGITWTAGRIENRGGSPFCIFGKFKAEEGAVFSFREENGCGLSPVRTSSLIMPAPPAECKWPAGTNDPPTGQSVQPQVTITPNPVTDYLMVSLSGKYKTESTPVELWIYDVNGRNVCHGELTPGPNRIDCTSLLRGIYLCRVISGTAILKKETFLKR